MTDPRRDAPSAEQRARNFLRQCAPQHRDREWHQIIEALLQSATPTDSERSVAEKCATVALEQRCQRGTPWDLACTTIADAIRAYAAILPASAQPETQQGDAGKEVERFNCELQRTVQDNPKYSAVMVPIEIGQWVRYEDYAALRADRGMVPE